MTRHWIEGREEDMRSTVHVDFFDTTLRDGDQSLPEENQFKSNDKLRAADAIANLGVKVIEAGFPASPGDREEVEQVAKVIGNKQYSVKRWKSGNSEPFETSRPPVIAGLSRALPEEIETTWNTLQYAEMPSAKPWRIQAESGQQSAIPSTTR